MMVFDHVLGDAERKREIAQLRIGRRRLVTTRRVISSTTALSRDDTSRPPATDFTSRPLRADRASCRPGAAAGSSWPDDPDASALASGAMMTSVKISVMARRLGIERAVSVAIAEGETGSQRSALGRVSGRTWRLHGLACLMMAQAAVRPGSNSATHS